MSAAASVADLVAACKTKPDLYNDKELKFLNDVEARSIMCAPLTAAQVEWLKGLAAREKLDFDAINAAALAGLTRICERWLPDGVVYGREFVARNPLRADANHGSFRINIETGKWADFAIAGVRGGDPISLAAYLFHSGDQVAAAKSLKGMVRL